MLKGKKELISKLLILSICTSLVPATVAFAEENIELERVSNEGTYGATTNEADFTFDASTGTITGYNGEDTTLTIPSTIGGVLVTSIGENAFQGCSNLTDITIPNSVKGIGNKAFYLCISLKTITIPNSVTSIGTNVFADCINLTSAIISSSMRKIPMNTFYNCTSLTSVTIPNNITRIESQAFYSCSSLKSIMIPDNVTIIKEYAFYNCTSLASITIPNGVARIAMHTFDNCANLTIIIIPDTVISIDDYAFDDCTGLKSITIPDSVTRIGYDTFSGCTNVLVYVNSEAVKKLVTTAYGFGDPIKPSQVIVSGQTATVKATSIDLNAQNLYLTVGKTQTFAPTVLPSDASNKGLIWETSNQDIAMVDKDGKITGMGVGTATITCTSKDGSKVSTVSSVTVTKGTVQVIKAESISLSTTTSSWAVGQTGVLIASILPSNTTNKTVTWSSSDNNIATVSSTGVVTARAAGSVTITATTNDGSGATGSKTITINNQSSNTTETKINAINLSGSSSISTKGGTITLTPNVLPSTATNQTVTWTSSNPSIATVSSTGVVTAIANGDVIITAIANDGSGVKGTKTITVSGQSTTGGTTPTDTKVTGITISGNSSISTKVGTITLTTNILPSTATNKAVTWTSSNPSVATVSSTGVVTAIANGNVIITATAADGSNISGTRVISVTGQATTANANSDSVLNSVSISGTEEVGHKLKAKVKYSGARPGLSYQWQRASKKDGDYSDINGADEEEYKLKSSDNNKYIKVIVTGTINGTNYRVEDITSKIDRDTSNNDEDDSSDSSADSSTSNTSNYYSNNNIIAFRPSTETNNSWSPAGSVKPNNTSSLNASSPAYVPLTNPSGHPVSGWANIDNKWYCLDNYGTAKVGWMKEDGNWYYLSPSSDSNRGIMKTGWIQDNGKWYYLNQSGAMVSNTTIDGYRLGADGAMI